MTIMNINTSENKDAVAEHTGQWLEKAVIGLNLCPFAKAPHVKNLVRIAISEAKHLDSFLEDLDEELQRLGNTPATELETTLLVHPTLFPDFDVFNDMLDIADAAVIENGLEAHRPNRTVPSPIPLSEYRTRRHRQLHQPFSLSDAAPHPRRQHCQSRTSLSRRFGNIRTQYRPAGKNGT